jgi:hypothetical protein
VGTTNVTISATNPVSTSSATLVITINTPAPPAINSALTASGLVGEAFNYSITATNSSTSYNATGLPNGLSVNTSTGAITGTPTAVGTTNVTISATNYIGTGSATLVLSITLPPQPVINSALTATGWVGDTFSYTITASNSPNSYNATGLPAGLSINTSTGAITGTPTAVAISNVTISATNAGGTGSAKLALTIGTLSGPIQVVQSATSYVDNNVPTTSASFSSNNTAGNFIVVVVGNNQGQPFTVTDSIGNVYQVALGMGGLGIYYAENIKGGGNTVTATMASGAAEIRMTVVEFSGVAASNAFDVTSFGYAEGPTLDSTSMNSGTVDTTVNGELLFGAAWYSDNSVTATGGYTLITTVPPGSGSNQFSEYQVQAVAGPAAATAQLANTPISGWYAGLATFKPAANTLCPPVINSDLTATGTLNTAFNYTITAINIPTSFNATGLPNGLSINASTGAITGTPTAGGTTNVTISATNAAGTDNETLVLLIGSYTVSGTITLNGSGLANVTVSDGTTSVTTDSSGNYSIPESGAYTLTASLSGYTFSPATQSGTVSNQNITSVDFAATASFTSVYTISGTIQYNSSGLAGVAVSCSAGSATTDNNGDYTITNVAPGSYTLTPTLSGYTFSPATLSPAVSNVNVTGQNFTATVVSNPTYTISGTIFLNSNGLSGVTVSCSAGSATTNSSGAYTISGVANGSYTLTPALAGYTFSPTSQGVQVNGGNATQNFTATQNTYTISGTVTLNGNGLSGVTVNYGGNNSVTTNGSGAYAISGVVNGSYTLTPSLAGYAFSPTSQVVQVNGGNATQNFTATQNTYTISGTITLNGNGLSGVTVNYGGNNSVTTNSTGAYTISGVANGSYTLTPTLAGYTFSPISQVVQVNSGNATQNFTATQNTYTINGTITLNGNGLSGVTVNYGGNNSVTTNSSGAYTISGVANGSYTLTPSLAGYTFNPTSQALTVSGGNATQNFTATINPPASVATPAFSPALGAYNSTQTVTISCATSGATIYYTTDGSMPTASSTKYTAPISISASTQLQAIAIETGLTNSPVISGVYNIAGSSTYVPDTDNDTDGNGYPDEVKTALGVSLTNPSATPLNMQVGITPQALTLSKLSVKLNFAKTTGSDEIMVSGLLPITANFVASSQTVVVDVGGVVQVFTLNSKGKGVAATGYPATSETNDHFGLKFKTVKGKVNQQTGTFTAQFNKGTFASLFADVGLLGSASVKDVARTVPVVILFNSQMYQTAQAVQYTATENKMGMAQFTH